MEIPSFFGLNFSKIHVMFEQEKQIKPGEMTWNCMEFHVNFDQIAGDLGQKMQLKEKSMLHFCLGHGLFYFVTGGRSTNLMLY